jgi:hypothetical protein
MINPALNRIANTPASATASLLAIGEPANCPSTPRSASTVKIIDGLDESSHGIPISNNPPLDPGSNELK